jgi:saccharopine dehydrogenase-like NADP-dependent oxidoreductase
VIIAGRDLAKAESCAARFEAQAAALDLNDPEFASRLAAVRPDLVISAAGPFQGQDYRVARAAIAAGAHYIDIADARGFVCGVTALDAEASAGNVLVISGASSVPALSAAVVDYLAPRFQQIETISHGISTSAQMPGTATVAALLTCCGKPLEFWRHGGWRSTFGWQKPMRYRFAAPVGTRWIAPCEIPDLELFPKRYARVESVQFRAGVESTVVQWGIALLSWAVRIGVIRNAAALSRPLRKIAVAMERFGSDRSAMFVKVSGVTREGANLTRVWELYADNNEGPNIPCMAAVAMARKLASKRIDTIGAMPCIGLITLEEYLAELQGLAIRTAEY